MSYVQLRKHIIMVLQNKEFLILQCSPVISAVIVVIIRLAGL